MRQLTWGVTVHYLYRMVCVYRMYLGRVKNYLLNMYNSFFFWRRAHQLTVRCRARWLVWKSTADNVRSLLSVIIFLSMY